MMDSREGARKGIEEVKLKDEENVSAQYELCQLPITCFTEIVNDVSLHFQIIQFPKQIYVWVGYTSAKLGNLYAAAHTRPNNNVSITSLMGGTSDNTGSGLACRLVLKTGLNVILACNIPKNSPMIEAEAEKILVQKLNSMGYGMLSLVEESTNKPAEENMMVVQVETQSQTEALSIVPIQVYLSLSQTTPVPEIEPTLMPEIKPTPAKSSRIILGCICSLFGCILSLLGCISSQLFCNTAALQNHRQKLKKAYLRFHQLHLKCKFSRVKFGFQYHSSILILIVRYILSCSNSAPEDAAALMMMARTASYIPKEGPMPSFSLGLTDSSQEEAATQEGVATQEGERAKTPETPKLIEQLGELVEKIAGSGVKTEGKTPQIQKQSGEESFEKFETPARTNEMTAEIKEKCYIWATRVKTYADGATNEYDAMCTLNAQDRYILSKIHFASLKAGVFLQPKTNKPFRVEDYPMFMPFLDLKKLASHPYIFAPVCYSNHWWLWVADARKKKFVILDPYHKTCPSDERMNINKFIVYLCSI
ncbi:hypothetical protein Ahy_B01g056466 isoform B [Arachis hypogaea]|uniref:Ubiquitin-like protease family profile domain-containing protein n=1 Tax=Arachis hypogaea TaxID=3818 RepID=A0A445AYW3_ARAHY|nr:hypothetical protein Ahy_B01g056466 isoform B [Arachis hypogaea]